MNLKEIEALLQLIGIDYTISIDRESEFVTIKCPNELVVRRDG